MAGLVAIWWLAIVKGRDVAAGAVLGLLVALKLVPALILIWLLGLGRWRGAIAALAAIAVSGLISLLGAGLDAHLTYIGVVSHTYGPGLAQSSIGGITHSTALATLATLATIAAVLATRARPALSFMIARWWDSSSAARSQSRLAGAIACGVGSNRLADAAQPRAQDRRSIDLRPGILHHAPCSSWTEHRVMGRVADRRELIRPLPMPTSRAPSNAEGIPSPADAAQAGRARVAVATAAPGWRRTGRVHEYTVRLLLGNVRPIGA